jgi:hypothetical protein
MKALPSLMRPAVAAFVMSLFAVAPQRFALAQSEPRVERSRFTWNSYYKDLHGSQNRIPAETHWVEWSPSAGGYARYNYEYDCSLTPPELMWLF